MNLESVSAGLMFRVLRIVSVSIGAILEYSAILPDACMVRSRFPCTGSSWLTLG